MTNILFSLGRRPTTQTEEHVRATAEPVQDDTPAEQTGAPEFNEHETDGATAGGLTTRDLASHVIPSEQYLPWHAPASHNQGDQLVNARWSSAGSAAAREAAGQWGHGTIQVVEGIEPVIREGGQFGGEYFAAERPGPGDDYLTPVRDVSGDGAVQAGVEDASRDAVAGSQANPYAAMYQAFQAGR